MKPSLAGRVTGKQGRGTAGKCLVMIAAEVGGKKIGRIS
jgi:hypothetical protein